jgi:hypothetical protein
MPATHFITDLKREMINAIGPTPTAPASVGTPVPGASSVEGSLPVVVSGSGGTLTYVASADASRCNGTYLYGVDHRITTTELDARHPVVITGRYSGCILRVFRTDPDRYVVMHVYNPGPNSALPAAADAYVRSRGGKDVVDMGSKGLIGPGIDSIWWVCELVPNGMGINVARLDVGSTGRIVRREIGWNPFGATGIRSRAS